MLQGFVTERKLLKASARLGVGKHHDTIRSLGRRWERWTLRKMRLNKADGKKEIHVISLSSGLPQHLVPVRTSLTTCVSRTGASGYIYPHHSLSKGPGYVLLTSSQNRTWACRMAGAHLFLNAWINQSM